MFKIMGSYFYGNKISDYGLENNRVDYLTLSKAFDCVLNNSIMEKTTEMGLYWEQESGFVDNSERIDELREQIEVLEELDTDNTEEIETLENEIEELENEQDYPPEIFQYYVIDGNGVDILKEIDEIVFYCDELDMYLWGVTHWGTAWDYVLTDIPCNCGA